MTKLKHYLFLTIFISTITLLSSCGAIVKSKANKNITEEKGAIPPDFGEDNSTIVFITHHRSYNKYLKKNVKKIYKGKYEFATEEEFETQDKYNDVHKYRYIFDYSYRPAGSVWKSNTINSGDFSTTTIRNRPALYNVKKFSVVDRKKEKIYKSNMTSSFWSKLQKVYLKKLNEKRMEN
ncbi:hypothetical protein [Olleya sp. HaHaR_3_96]|uniref:hypothetical protein n=1 Tax=Olleya sp. HaHaR_3_96 TaxID=2745560 RepID=UPI001C4F1EDD|nr:hypothetical protein [Olleya sp. HaHaR_3_96]QXP60437.1 hypothetical protein H0I26_01975 [Olleya sp. HaHaR_3_96]